MEETFQKITYHADAIKSLSVSLAFKDRFSTTNGMDWDSSGEVMVTSSQDKAVYLYSVNKAGVTNVLQSKKHGVVSVRFTNEGPRHIVCGSCSEAPVASVKLWDTVENRYIKSFSLNAPVVKGRGISPHPSREMMLVSTCDNMCSLYSYDNTSPMISYTGTGIIGAFDSLGVIFALYRCTESGRELALYDVGKNQVPFTEFDMDKILLKDEKVLSLDFNPNGLFVVLGTNHRRLLCIDAMKGSLVFSCSYGDSHIKMGPGKDICYPSISPDGNYLLCGCSNGDISIWDFQGNNICRKPGHEGPPYFTCFNPKKALVSSACIKVAWWQPKAHYSHYKDQ